jgi:tetrahydromethanopterin S-methyltransferase subunit B
MDNQDSSPAITFPNVPDDFCPTGNWQNVFQQFIDEVISNGTINVPGLGDVTPQQIAQINEDLADQQTQISALDTRVDALEPAVKARYGTITSIPTGDSVQTVSFSSLPSAIYGVAITPICNATILAQPTPLFALVSASKTNTGFSIRIENNVAEITSVDWMAVHSA